MDLTKNACIVSSETEEVVPLSNLSFKLTTLPLKGKATFGCSANIPTSQNLYATEQLHIKIGKYSEWWYCFVEESVDLNLNPLVLEEKMNAGSNIKGL